MTDGLPWDNSDFRDIQEYSIALLSQAFVSRAFLRCRAHVLRPFRTIIRHGSPEPRSTKAMSPQEGLHPTWEEARLSEAVDDPSRMLLAIPGLETDPCAMKLVRGLARAWDRTRWQSRPGSCCIIDATIAAWAVTEHREDIAEALRADMEEVILGETQLTCVEHSGDIDYEDTPTGTRPLEEKPQSLHMVEGLAVDVGDGEFLRHPRYFRSSLIDCTSSRQNYK